MEDAESQKVCKKGLKTLAEKKFVNCYINLFFQIINSLKNKLKFYIL